jgi:PadR family transcriptional regulator, regulatory protein PadR
MPRPDCAADDTNNLRRREAAPWSGSTADASMADVHSIEMRADLLRGHVDSLLLAALSDAAGHGYEISQRLTRTSGGELAVNEGSLYPALHRLERGGLVTSAWSANEGRRRRVYEITDAGRRAVADSRREWKAFSTAVDQVMGTA